MPSSRSDYSSAVPLQVGTSPLIEAIETNFASLVSSLKDLDAVRKRSSSSRDGPEKLAAACDQFCTSSKRVMRATIQSVDKMVEEYSHMKHRHPTKLDMPMLVDRSTPTGSRGTESARMVDRIPRDMIMSQKVIDYWKMYCFGQKVKRAVEKRQTEMLSHLQSAQRLAEGAKAEVSQVEQKEAALKSELLRSQLECQSLMKQVQELNSTIYRLETEGHKSSGKPDEKMRQVQSDLRLLNEQLQKSDETARQVSEELRTLREEQGREKAQFAQLLEEKHILEAELAISKRTSSSTGDQKDMEIRSLTAALNERDRKIAQLESLTVSSRSDELLSTTAEKDRRISEFETQNINNPLQLQIKTLKLAVAERDKKLAELEGDNLTLSLASTQVGSLEERLKTLTSAITERDKKISQLESEKLRSAEVQALEAEKKVLLAQQGDLANKVSKIESEKQSLIKENEELVSAAGEKERKLFRLETERSGLVSLKEELMVAVAEKDKKLAQLETLNVTLTAKQTELADAVKERDLRISELDKVDIEEVLVEKDATISDLLSEKTRLIFRKGQLESQLAEKEHKIAQLEGSVAKAEERVVELSAAVSDRDRIVGKLESSISLLQASEAELKTKLQGQDRKLQEWEDWEESEKSLNEKIESLVSEIGAKDRTISQLEKEAERAKQLLAVVQEKEIKIANLTEEEEHGKLLAVALEQRDMRIRQLELELEKTVEMANELSVKESRLRELETVENRAASLTSTLTEKDKRIAQLEDAREEIANLSSQIAQMAEKLTVSDTDMKALAGQLRQADERYEKVKSENIELQKQLVELKASSTTRIEDLSKQLQKSQLGGETNAHKLTQMQMERQRNDSNRETIQAQLRSEISALKEQLARLDPETVKEIEYRNEQLTQEIQEMTDRLQMTVGESRVLRMQLASLKKVLVEAGVVTDRAAVESDSVQTVDPDRVVRQAQVQTTVDTNHALSGPEHPAVDFTEVQTIDIHYDEICEAVTQLRAEQAGRELAVAESNKRVVGLGDEIAKLNFQLAEKELANGRLSQDVLDLKLKLESGEVGIVNLQTTIKSLSEQLEEKQARLEVLSTELMNRQQMIDELSGQLSPKQAAALALQRSVDDLTMQLSGKASEVVKLQCAVDELKSELELKKSELLKLTEQSQGSVSQISELQKAIVQREEFIGELQRQGTMTVRAFEDRIQFLLSQISEKEQALGEIQFKMGYQPKPKPVAPQTSMPLFDQMIGKLQISASNFVTASPADSIQLDSLRAQLSASEQSAKELRFANSALLERMINHANLLESDVISSHQAALEQSKRDLAQSSSVVAAKDLEISKLVAEQRLIQQQLTVAGETVSEVERKFRIQSSELETVKEELKEVLRDAKHMQDRYEGRLRELTAQVKVADASVRDEKEIEQALQKRIKSLETEIADNLKDQQEWDEISSAMKDEIDELLAYKEKADVLSKREAELQAQIELLDQDLNAAEAEIEELTEKFEKTSKELAVKSKAESELRSRVEEVETAYESIVKSLKGTSAEGVGKMESEIKELRSQLTDAARAIRGLAVELAEADDAALAMKNLLSAAEIDLERLVSDLADSESQKRRLEEMLGAAESDKSKLRKQITAIQNSDFTSGVEDTLRANLAAVRLEADQFKHDFEKLQQRMLAMQEPDERVVGLENLLEDKEREISDLREQLELVESQVGSVGQLKQELELRARELKHLKSELEKKQNDVEIVSESVLSLREQLLVAEDLASKASRNLEEREVQLSQREEELSALQRDRDELAGLVVATPKIDNSAEFGRITSELVVAKKAESALRSELESIQNQLQLTEKLRDEAVGARATVQARLDAATKNLQTLRVELDRAVGVQESLQDQLEKSVTVQDSLREQLNELVREKGEFIARLNRQPASDHSGMESELRARSVELEKTILARDGLRAELRESEEYAESLRTELEKSRTAERALKAQIAELIEAQQTDRTNQLETEIVELNNELKSLEEANKKLESKVAALLSENAPDARIVELQKDLDEADKTVNALEKRIVDLKADKANMAVRESELKEALETCESELGEIRRRRASKSLTSRVGKFELFALSTHGGEQLVAVLQSSLKKAEARQLELLDERVKLEAQITQLRTDGTAKGNEEMLTTINKLVDEKSALTNRLTRLEELLDSKPKGKVQSQQQVIRDIVAQAKPGIVLHPLSDYVAVDAGGSVLRYVGMNKDADMCGCAITNSPLPLFEEGVYFEVRITQTQQGNPDGLTVGLTTTPPWQGEPVPNTLDDIPNAWAVGYNGQCWNGAKGEWKQIEWSGKDLVEGQRVGVFLAAPPVSQLFIFVDDILVVRGPTRLPSCEDHPFYGLVDMLGNCDSVTLLWGAKPPPGVQDLVAIDPRKMSAGQFRLPLRRGIQSSNPSFVSEESSIIEETSPMRKVAVPRLPLKPTVEPSGFVRPPSESDSDTFRR